MSQSLIDSDAVYDFLRVGSNPPDDELIEALTVAAEVRLETFIGTTLAELLYETDALPEPLIRAICLDVATHYFSRLDPVLPDAYFDAIQPWRAWSFGA